MLASFDLWATLLDTGRFHREIALRLSENLGLEASAAGRLLERAYRAVREERARGLIRGERPVEDSLRVAERVTDGLLEPDALLQAAAEAAYTVDAEELVIPGARSALEWARERGFTVGIVSNVVFWHGQVSRLLLWRSGLSSLVDFQVYADEAGCLKPDRCIFREALSRAGSEPGCSVHVGDNFREDLLGALLAGMRGVLVEPGAPRRVDRVHGFAVVPEIGGVAEAVEELFHGGGQG